MAEHQNHLFSQSYIRYVIGNIKLKVTRSLKIALKHFAGRAQTVMKFTANSLSKEKFFVKTYYIDF